ncbi:MAG: hypothetical protein LBI67_12655 [Treponema sp.]|jgi:alpha-L-rhamnosidase|nr:hypothetical protein [Treponema sp.]
MLRVLDLRCEYRTNPINVFTVKPRFSWKLESDRTGVTQTFWSIEVAEDNGFGSLL